MNRTIYSHLAITVGLILFAIGLAGVSGHTLEVQPFLSVLMAETKLGHTADQIYYFVLLLLGFWLTLCVQVRIPASIALSFVLGKVAVVGGEFQFGAVFPLALSISLALILWRMTVNAQWHTDQHSRDGNFW